MTGEDDLRDRGHRPAVAGQGPPGDIQSEPDGAAPGDADLASDASRLQAAADRTAAAAAADASRLDDDGAPAADVDRPAADTDESRPAAAAAAAAAATAAAEADIADADRLDEAAADAAAAGATPEVEAAIEADEAAIEVEEDIAVAGVAQQRDEYLDALRRLQADFENYKKRMIRQQTDHLERAAASLVEKLLPVFDTADLAIAHGGGEEVKQIWTALFETLEREGLERIDPLNVAFDPTMHDAVAHEPGDGDGEPEVVEVMRAGYRWKGRILRPAMVKVRG